MNFDSNRKAAVLADFALSLVEAAKKSEVSGEDFDLLLTRAQNIANNTVSAIKRDKVYSGLEDVDNVRDALIRDIKAVLRGCSAMPDDAIKTGARELSAIFDKYTTTITRAKYEEESTYIRSMLGDFGAEKLAAAVKVVPGFSDLVSKLKAAQDDFDAKYSEYMKARANSEKSATELKKELLEVVNAGILPYIDAVSLVNDGAKKLKAEAEQLLSHAK